MKTLRILLVAVPVALAGCSDDDLELPLKGVVDTDSLSAGATVQLQGSLGTVSVPFTSSRPIPDVPDADFEDEMDGAVSLVVSNPATGTTVDLAAGELVASAPSGAGEFTWAIASDRASATITFYNQTGSGLNLDEGSTYTAQLSIATNDYVQRVTPMTFDVSVE